jgi:hypothetical protein
MMFWAAKLIAKGVVGLNMKGWEIKTRKNYLI